MAEDIVFKNTALIFSITNAELDILRYMIIPAWNSSCRMKGTDLSQQFHRVGKNIVFNVLKNEHYLSRCYNKGKETEFLKYHRSKLEAKIYFGNNLVCSIASEKIENLEEYGKQSDETVKQDCESKAFIRLVAKIKKKFPRLPIIITADSLYVTQNVLRLCKEYKWDYVIRYKEGSTLSIAGEYLALPEREQEGAGIEFPNGIVFEDYDVNLIYYRKKHHQREGKSYRVCMDYKFKNIKEQCWEDY